MALVGSALVLMWNAAFSFAVSVASTLGIDPLLLFLKLRIELLRLRVMVRKGPACERQLDFKALKMVGSSMAC